MIEKLVGDVELILLADLVFGELVVKPESFVSDGRRRKHAQYCDYPVFHRRFTCSRPTMLYYKVNYTMKALLESLQPGEKDWALAHAIDPSRVPAHIAIIMDGNGRWAGRRRLPRVAGHRAGIGPVRATVEACARLGVKVLTLYAFSVENWKRPRGEVETLWRLLRYYLRQELPDLQKNDIRLQAIGRLDALPVPVRRELEFVIDATSSNRGLVVNLAINYGGRAEIID